MFDIGWGELVVIGVVALIAIGPKELPGVLRSVGQMMAKVRRMASEFQGQFHEAMREAEMADVKKTVEDTASSFASYDPLADVKKSVEGTLDTNTDPLTAVPPPGATEPVAAQPAVGAPEAVKPPDVDISIPLPEPLPAVTENDFAPVEPAPKKQAGGGA